MSAAENTPPAVLPLQDPSKSKARASKKALVLPKRGAQPAAVAAVNSCVEGYYCRSSGYESDGRDRPRGPCTPPAWGRRRPSSRSPHGRWGP
jgi:hypothetical protein